MDTTQAENVNLDEVILHNAPPPENPKPFNERLRKEYGEIQGNPRFRVVWGQGEESKIWQSGKRRLRYVCAIQTYVKEVEYQILMPSGQIRKLTPNQLKRYVPKKGEIIVPVEERTQKEIGLPFWFLEFFAVPEQLGTEEQWNQHRWHEGVDILGVYPRNGRYEPLLELSGIDNETGSLTVYRPLNDNTWQFIASALKGEKKTIDEIRRNKAAEFENLWDEMMEGFDREAYDVPKKPLYFLPEQRKEESRIITL